MHRLRDFDKCLYSQSPCPDQDKDHFCHLRRSSEVVLKAYEKGQWGQKAPVWGQRPPLLFVGVCVLYSLEFCLEGWGLCVGQGSAGMTVARFVKLKTPAHARVRPSCRIDPQLHGLRPSSHHSNVLYFLSRASATLTHLGSCSMGGRRGAFQGRKLKGHLLLKRNEGQTGAEAKEGDRGQEVSGCPHRALVCVASLLAWVLLGGRPWAST